MDWISHSFRWGLVCEVMKFGLTTRNLDVQSKMHRYTYLGENVGFVSS